MKVKATVNDGNKVVAVETVEVEIPNTIEALVKKYGAEFCASRLQKALVIDYQAFMRAKMYKKAETDENGKITKRAEVGLKGKDLQEAVDEYAPTLRKKGKSFLEKVREQSEKMSDEEKRALIEELTGNGAARRPAPAARTAPSRTVAPPARRPAPTASRRPA